jgi:prevent-host-death family protein
VIVNVHEAKTQLSRLLERVAAGEEVIIGKAGRPVARLVPYSETPRRRTPGRWKGRVRVAADFDDTPAEVIAAFEAS